MTAMVAGVTIGSYSLLAEPAVQADFSESWPSGSSANLGTTSGTVFIETSTDEVAGTDEINVSSDANYTISVNEGGDVGYGVLGNGETVINVQGSGSEISDTSLNIHAFMNVAELNIDGNAVVTLAPGMFMNGDMTHDIAGKEGLEKSLGVRIGEINLISGSLILNNGSGYLFDNGYYDSGTVKGDVGYTLNIGSDNAYLEVGSNMRTKWEHINGEVDGQFHDLTIAGNARVFDVTKISGIKDLSIQGGQIFMDNCQSAVNGDLTIGDATVTLGGDNIMAEGSGTITIMGSLSIGSTTQVLTGSNTIYLGNGGIFGQSSADDTTDGLQLRTQNISANGEPIDNTVKLIYKGMSNLITADIDVSQSMSFENVSEHESGQVQDALHILGALSGAGNMSISGSGMVVLSNDNSHFTGEVMVGNGSTLSLNHTNALANAEHLVLGDCANLYLNTDGAFPVTLKELSMGVNSTLGISKLSSSLTANAGQAAISSDRFTMTSGGHLNVVFGEELRTMGVYSIFHTQDDLSSLSSSAIQFFMRDSEGKTIAFEDGHYVYGINKLADGSSLLYVETRFGNIWNGGAENSWTSSAQVWNKGKQYDGSDYDYALFFNQEGVDKAVVKLDEPVSVKGIYVQNVGTDVSGTGSTTYIFEGDGNADTQEIEGGTEFHMRDTAVGTPADNKGNGSRVEFRGVQAGSKEKPMGWFTISVGSLKLTNSSNIHYNGDRMIQVGADNTAELLVEAGSQIISATGAIFEAFVADILGVEQENPIASISGVKMTNNAILGGNTDSNFGISAITNAQMTGYDIEAVELRGVGAIIDGGIGADTGLSTDYNGRTNVHKDAHYTLGGSIVRFNAQLANEGIVTLAAGTKVDFTYLDPVTVNGNTYSYTFIDGGTVNGWTGIGLDRFVYGDVLLSELASGLVSINTSSPGKADITFNGIQPITWDAGWGLSNAPKLGKAFVGTNWHSGVNDGLNLADGAINFAASDQFKYNQIVTSASDKDIVVFVLRDSDSDSEGDFLAGGCNWGEQKLSGNIWIYDEGSDYNTKIGGFKRGWGESSIPELIGDSHLQIVGESHLKDVLVYGGSWGIRQKGDAYLSINAGGYKDIYGASADAELNGNVHMQLHKGTLNTYYEGAIFNAPEGWTTVGGTTVGNKEFEYNSYEDAVWVLSGYSYSDGVPPNYELDPSKATHWGGIYATGVNSGDGTSTEVLGNADIYLGSEFDFSSNLAVIDGGAAHVTGQSTLHLVDGKEYANLNKETIYVWISAVNGYRYWDQHSATEVKGAQPFMGKYTSIAIRGFDRIELADGAKVTLQSSRFNTDTDVTISGGGVIELLRPEVFQLNYYDILQAPFCEKDSEQGRTIEIPRRNITLVNGARLKVSTDFITAWNADSGFTALTSGMSAADRLAVSRAWSSYYDPSANGRSDITVTDGTTLDISDWQRDTAGGNMLIDLFISGHGTDGLGALYKGVSSYDRDTAAFFQFPYIEVTGNTSIGIAAGASPIYMYGADNVYDNKLSGGEYVQSDYLGDYNQSTLKLNNHTLTITGGTFKMVNTTVPDEVGGTIYVEEGTLTTINTPDHRVQNYAAYGLSSANDARHVTIARTTDIVLTEYALLHTTLNNGSDNLSVPLGSGLQSLKIASLSGAGETNLEDFGLNGIELIVKRDQFYTEFLDDSQKYWNQNGYAYAVYSGAILGDSDSSVSKSGDGVQYFSGSESTYGSFMTAGKLGGTYVSGGILYALGTSDFHKSAEDSFTDGMTRVDVGVFGSGDMYWTSYKDASGVLHEGRVYLSDGVRITNPGSYYLNPQLPADMHPDKKNMIIGVEAAPNGTALNATDANGYIFLVDQNDDKVSSNQDGKEEHSGYITLNGVNYVRIDTHNLSKLNGVNGIYLDGSEYRAGEVIDRDKMLLLSAADWEKVKSGQLKATVTGLGTAGYNEATWSGLLHDEMSGNSVISACLVKESAGTLVLDQITSYSGTTTLAGGTLSLKGWVDPNRITKAGTFTMVEGSSLKLSFDGTYTDGGMDVDRYAATGEVVMKGNVNEDTELSENLVLVGCGDKRWNDESGWQPSWVNDGTNENFTDGETAALISDVGAGVDFTISGKLSGEGNLLHSGNGTLTLTNANTYTGGTVVTRSHVYVEHDTALGDTDSGLESARVVTWKNSHLHFADGVHTTIAAPTTNSIEGSVYIGEAVTKPQATQLTMTGNGYWAEQTYVENHNSTLLFSEEGATNTGADEIGDNADDYLGHGAGVITGKGTIAVSDVDTNAAGLASVMTDSFAELRDYTGSVVVEGEGATLSMDSTTSSTGGGHDYIVRSGVSSTSGQVTVSGQGAHFSAVGADIIVSSGSSMNLTSTAYSEFDRSTDNSSGFETRKAATVTANSVTISDGAALNVSHAATTWQYNIESLAASASVELKEVLQGYELQRGTQVALDGAEGYNYHYDQTIALNQTAAGATDVQNLVLQGGATYRPTVASTSLNGGNLTLDVSNGSLIGLDITLDGELYQKERRQQIVLFSGVDSIDYLGVGAQDKYAHTIDGVNDIYFTKAENYFAGDYINENVYLVWDSSAGVVYLDVVPEPATATLSLLGLAALAARRRRRK